MYPQRRELKLLVRRQPNHTLLAIRSEVIQWELEGLPGGVRGRSHSVVSVGSVEAMLHPCTVGGTLDTVSVVSLPSGVTTMSSGIENMSSHTVSPAVPQQVGETDLSSLSADQQSQVRSLLGQDTCLFSSRWRFGLY